MDSGPEGGKKANEGGGQLLLLNGFRRRAVRFIAPPLITLATNVTNRETARSSIRHISHSRVFCALERQWNRFLSCIFHLQRAHSDSRRVYLPLHARPFFPTISLCRCKKLKRWKLVVPVKYSRPVVPRVVQPRFSLFLYLRFTNSTENSSPDTVSGKYFAILFFKCLRSNKFGIFFLLLLLFSTMRILSKVFDFTCQWNFDKESNSIFHCFKNWIRSIFQD